jgi:PAS domain S-box-containing protein
MPGRESPHHLRTSERTQPRTVYLNDIAWREIQRLALDGRTNVGRIVEKLVAGAARALPADHFRRLSETVGDFLWQVDDSGRAVGDLPCWRAFTGQSAEGVAAHGWLQAVHPADRSVIERLWLGGDGGAVFLVHCRVRSAVGQYYGFELRGVPVLDDHSRCLGLVAVGQRLMAESTPSVAADEHYRLLDAFADIHWLARPDGWSEFFNRAWTEFTGMDTARAVGWGWQEAVHPEDLPLVVTLWQGSVAAAHPFDVEFRLRAADGSYRRHRLRASPERDGSGQVVRWCGTCVALEAVATRPGELARPLREAEPQLVRARRVGQIAEALRARLEPEQVYQTAVDLIGSVLGVDRCALYLVDEELPEVLLPTAECVQAGYRSVRQMPLPVGGHSHLARVLGDDDVVVIDDLADAAHLDTLHPWDIRAMLAVRTAYHGRLNGVICVHQCAAPHRWSTEEIDLLQSLAVHAGVAVAHAQLLARERRQSLRLGEQNRALEEARHRAELNSRARASFLALMSHEIRTPLNGVLGMAQVLQGSGLDAERCKLIESILEVGNGLLCLLDDLLDYSKLEAGRLELEETAFELRACIQSSLDVVASRAAEKNLVLDVQSAAGLPAWVMGDRYRLRQVLVNLLGNAVKFTEQGQVRLRVEAEEDKLHFCIEDTGIGIAPERLRHLFEPFHQADPSISRRYGGTGLGLAICRQIVEAMGGHIGVESTSGVGSHFKFTVPLRAVASTTPPPAAPLRAEPSTRARLRILLVEDNAVNRMVALRLLEQLGCRADVANSGQEALALIDARTYDLVLMDVRMPELDGLEVTRRVRARHDISQPRIVALTAGVTLPERAACLSAGMDDCLPKPLHRERLADCLDRLVGEADRASRSAVVTAGE